MLIIGGYAHGTDDVLEQSIKFLNVRLSETKRLKNQDDTTFYSDGSRQRRFGRDGGRCALNAMQRHSFVTTIGHRRLLRVLCSTHYMSTSREYPTSVLL